MSYTLLLDHCQTLPVYIKRNLVRDKALSLVNIPKVSVVKTDLDTQYCRGFYLSARNMNARLVQQHGTHVIALARSLNKCWERFVFVKELMHLFDDPEQATDSGAAFDALLGDFTGPRPPRWSPQMVSEQRCFWMALAVLCPEDERKALMVERANGKKTDYEIALRLMIPELYIQRLALPNYPDIVASLRNGA